MSKYNLLKADFSGGEISPKAEANPDNEEVKNGVARLENFTVYKSGGASKRTGTIYQSTLALGTTNIESNVSKPVNLARRVAKLPFNISASVAFNVVIPVSSYDNNILTPKDFQIIPNVSSLTTVITGTKLHFSQELDGIGFRYVQSGDILFVTHNSGLMEPFRLELTGVEGDTYTFKVGTLHDGMIAPTANVQKTITMATPYLAPNIDGGLILKSSSTTGQAVTISMEDAVATPVPFFTPEHVGALFKITHGAVTGSFRVNEVGTGTALAAADVNTGTDTINQVAHGLNTGDKLYFQVASPSTNIYSYGSFTNDGAIHVGYYVIKIDDDNFRLAETLNNTTFNIFIALSGPLDCEYRVGGTKYATASASTMVNLGANTGSDNWEEGAWSNFQGFPKDVTIYEQRLIWMATERSPDTIWASVTGNLFRFMQRKLAQDSTSDSSGLNYYGAVSKTDAFSFAVAGADIPRLNWISSEKVLQAGSLGQEFVISGGNEAISALPGTIIIQSHTSNGGSSVNTVRSGNSVIYTSRDGQRLRNFKFNEANGSYIAQNLNLFADEIVLDHGKPLGGEGYSDSRIAHAVYQKSRNIIWVLTTRNKLISLTYDEDREVVAWCRHEIGGEDVKVLNINAITSHSGIYDSLWMVVERTVDGATAVHVEKMGIDFGLEVLTAGGVYNEDDAPFFADSSILIVSGSPQSVFTVPHLLNHAVDVLADGKIVKDIVTDGSGNFTLDVAATKVVVGINYASKITSLNISGSGDFGTPEGNKQRIDRLYLRLLRSYGGLIGSSADELEDIEYEFNNNNELFTGGVRHLFSGDPTEISRYYIVHDEPVPFNILSVTVRGVNYD